MAVDVLDFAKNVEFNRKKLVSNLNKIGENVSESISLTDATSRVENVFLKNTSESTNYHRVRWVGPDKVYKDILLKTGDSVPSVEDPAYDPEHLEFVRWAKTSSDTIVTKDIDYGAIYRVKADVNGKRWTHLFFYFYDTYLSPTIRYYKGTADSTLIIDWGDGTIQSDFSVNTGTVTHTYTKPGLYTIKAWCDYKGWGFNGTGSNQNIISAAGYVNTLYKIYCGDNFELNNYSFYNQWSLNMVVIPDTVETLGGKLFNAIRNLGNVILPNSIKSFTGTNIKPIYCPCTNIIVEEGVYNGVWKGNFIDAQNSVNHFVIPDGVSTLAGLSGLRVSRLRVPKSVVATYVSGISNCSNLRDIIIEQPSSLDYLNHALSSLNCIKSFDLNIFPNLTQIVQVLRDCNDIEVISLPSTLISMSGSLINNPNLSILNIPNNFDMSLDLTGDYSLSDECLYNITINIKDNNGGPIRVLTLANNLRSKLQFIHINNLGEMSYDSSIDNSLLTYIQNKNWTVTFV